MSSEKPKTFVPSDNWIVSFFNSPSRATIRDLDRDQFVFLRTREGSIGSFLLEVAEDILLQVDQLQKTLNQNPPGFDRFQYLKLRGIWFDNLRGNIISYIELLYPSEDEPELTEEQILKAFENGWYDGQIAQAEATLTAVNVYSEHFFPLNDSFYEKFKKYLLW